MHVRIVPGGSMPVPWPIQEEQVLSGGEKHTCRVATLDDMGVTSIICHSTF